MADNTDENTALLYIRLMNINSRLICAKMSGQWIPQELRDEKAKVDQEVERFAQTLPSGEQREAFYRGVVRFTNLCIF